MLKSSLKYFPLILIAIASQFLFTQAFQRKPIIGPIYDYGHKQECGCNFFLVSRDRSTVIFHSENTATGILAWMNLSGKDISLKQIKEIRPPRKHLRVGDKIVRHYTAGSYQIKVEQTLTSVCDPKNDSCEYETSDVIIRVAKGKQTETLKATGGCGCG